jgi:hypothetical protein
LFLSPNEFITAANLERTFGNGGRGGRGKERKQKKKEREECCRFFFVVARGEGEGKDEMIDEETVRNGLIVC